MKTIILDRDGVINEDSYGYIGKVEDWHAISGSLAAMAAFHHAGWRVFVVTNQSGIGRGLYDLAAMHAIHTKMQHALHAIGGHITAIFFCPHHPDAQCRCRKPQPGMLLDLQKQFQVDFSTAYFVGDKMSDVSAARGVGCQPLLVLTGEGKKTVVENPDLDVPVFANLAEIANFLLERQNEE